MQTSIVHSFDEEDGGVLAAERVTEALNLLATAVHAPTQAAVEAGVRSAEGLNEEDFAGLRAVRRIRGGAFTAEDVAAFQAYIGLLARRHRASAEAMEREGAPGAFVAGVRDTAAHAERIASDFANAFRAAAPRRL